MALLFPLILIGLGFLAFWIAYWIDPDPDVKGIGLVVGLFDTMILGALACGAYGVYIWLKTGIWGSISIEATLMFIGELGIDVSFFFKPVSWLGVQAISDQYLASNLGWTVLIVSGGLLIFFLLLQPPRRTDQGKHK